MLSEIEAEPFLKTSELGNESFQSDTLKTGTRFPRYTSFTQWLTETPTVSHSLVFISTSLFWGFYFLILPSLVRTPLFLIHSDPGNSTIIPNADYIHCGSSVHDARSRGCEYDILNNHWVPSPCIDAFAIEEYQSDGSWFGYTDWNHTELLEIEKMGETPVYYTSERDHIVHCAMLWRKQYRALMDGRKYLDSIVVDEEHTMHCSNFLIEMTDRGPDFRTMPIEVFVGYAGCHVRNEVEG